MKLRTLSLGIVPLTALILAAGPDVVNAVMGWWHLVAGRDARATDDQARVATRRSSRGPF
jgi:hypothetical protein